MCSVKKQEKTTLQNLIFSYFLQLSNMAAVCARGIAQEIREHPMFDRTDETQFIAGYIFDMIMGDREVSEEVWNKVLTLLFEDDEINLLYDLPEECQLLINKFMFSQNIIKNIPKKHTFNHGPISDRVHNMKYYYAIHPYYHIISSNNGMWFNRIKEIEEKIITSFFNSTTRDIRKFRKINLQRQMDACDSMAYGPPCEMVWGLI